MLSSAITLTISTPLGPINGVWRPSERRHTAVLLLPGRDGALDGPASLYAQLAPTLQRVAPVAQMGYRVPGDFDDALATVRSALETFGRQGVERVALIGWDFGASVAIAAASSRIVTGVAALAPDVLAGDHIGNVGPRRLLLLHGSDDAVTPQSVSLLLHAQSGPSSELSLLLHETHEFTLRRAAILQRLTTWTSTLLRSPFKPAGIRDSAPLRAVTRTR